MREVGYRRFWQKVGRHAPIIERIDLGPLAGNGTLYQDQWGDGGPIGTVTTRLEASDDGLTWYYVGDLPMNGFVVPTEHKQHRYWRVYYRVDTYRTNGFDNLAYYGGAYCRYAHFWAEDGSDILAGMYTNPSSMWVLGRVVSIWYGLVWGWGLVGGMNGGPAGGTSGGQPGGILAQSGSHGTLYTDCTYSPVPFELYGYWGFSETVWATPGGFEITWSWDLTNGYAVIPGEGPAGFNEEGWGTETLQVKNGQVTLSGRASRGSLTFYDKDTGRRLTEEEDWEIVNDESLLNFTINTDAAYVVAYYRIYGATLRSRPGRGRITSGNVIADKVRFSDIKGF